MASVVGVASGEEVAEAHTPIAEERRIY